MLDTLSEEQRELRINRTIYWLRQGVPSAELEPSRIGVEPADMPEIRRIAAAKLVENDRAYARMTRQGSLVYMAVGAVLLGMAYVLSFGEVPLLRQGRLVFGIALGGASLAWGLFRFFDHNPDHEF